MENQTLTEAQLENPSALSAPRPLLLNRGTLVGAALALTVSFHSILIFCFGMAGVSGNSTFTAGLLVALIGAIILLGSRRNLRFVPTDFLFLAWLTCIAASAALTEGRADLREITLFIISLTAYPAFRFISLRNIDDIRTTFVLVTGTVVAAGTIATIYAIAIQWSDPHGKPIVFGFDAAPTAFMTVCGFLIIAATSATLTWRRTIILSSFIFIPVAVFSASQVRLTLAATIGTLLVSALVSGAGQKKFNAIVVLAVLAGICVGGACRYSTTKTFLAYALQKTRVKHDAKELVPPSCNLAVDLDNSIAIRKALLRDGSYLIPRAGPFGLGLDSFAGISCLNMEAHNSFLQAFVEFGWIGGLCLTLAVMVAAVRLFSPAGIDHDAKFALCCLTYVGLLSLGSGNLSHDLLLFAMLGLAAEPYQRRPVPFGSRWRGSGP